MKVIVLLFFASIMFGLSAFANYRTHDFLAGILFLFYIVLALVCLGLAILFSYWEATWGKSDHEDEP